MGAAATCALGFFAGMFLSLLANVLLISNTEYDLEPEKSVGNAFGQAVGAPGHRHACRLPGATYRCRCG